MATLMRNPYAAFSRKRCLRERNSDFRERKADLFVARDWKGEEVAEHNKQL